ncbi:MAG TPA: T9SS type A sorting domain-containing protein [Flavobacterium sp.]|jgi:hypothetical protein
MKKITSILFTALAFTGFAQQKSTGVVTLTTNMTANLTLDNATSTATLTLSGPNDRYFALQFGSFGDREGMLPGTDLVYYNGTILVDASQNGINVTPPIDTNNNWTLVSNNDNNPSTGLRTIVYTRPFNTSDSNDYTFNYSDTTIDFAWARRSSTGYVMSNHFSGNRGYSVDVPLATLGTEDFSLNASQVYPNPSNGAFLIKTKTSLEKVNIYSQTGAFVRTIDVKDGLDTEVNVIGLPTGIYLLELTNATSKGWKKVIVK